MNRWLAHNPDAVAVAIIVLVALAAQATTFDAVIPIRMPELLREARSFAGRVRGIFERRQNRLMHVIQAIAHPDAGLAPPASSGDRRAGLPSPEA